MQTIGLIGGMSWESSAAYYELLNTGVEKRVGPWLRNRLLTYKPGDNRHDTPEVQPAE